MNATTESGSEPLPNWEDCRAKLKAKVDSYVSRTGDAPNVLYLGHLEYRALHKYASPAVLAPADSGHVRYNGWFVVHVGLYTYLEVGYAS